MKRYLVIAIAALGLAPLSLAAQDPGARIQAAEARAAAAGVPVALLRSRVAEGRAKGIPMDRIAAAVERRAASLLQAREVMGRVSPVLTAADLNAGADAVEAGIDAGALRAVIEGTRAEDRHVAVAVLTYLHDQQGLPVSVAVQRVTDAVKNGPEALRRLPTQAASQAQQRGGPKGQPGQGRPPHAGGAGRGGGPPDVLPSPGQKPGGGKPEGVGNPGKGKPDGKGNPGKGNPGQGRPGGKP